MAVSEMVVIRNVNVNIIHGSWTFNTETPLNVKSLNETKTAAMEATNGQSNLIR